MARRRLRSSKLRVYWRTPSRHRARATYPSSGTFGGGAFAAPIGSRCAGGGGVGCAGEGGGCRGPLSHVVMLIARAPVARVACHKEQLESNSARKIEPPNPISLTLIPNSAEQLL